MLPLLLAAGCYAPGLRNAHSLDAGDVEVSFSASAPMAGATTTVLAGSGDYFTEAPLLDEPDLGDVVPEFHIGLGGGLELGTRGIPVLGGTEIKWSMLDERRHETPLSLAVAAEVSLDPYQERAFGGRVGLLTSSTWLLSADVGLRPAIGAWYGTGGHALHFDLPYEAGDHDGGDPELELTYTGHGLSLPVGLELPIRAGNFAITPFVAYTAWFPMEAALVEANCTSCTVTTRDLDVAWTGFAWAGVRWAPWFSPLRSQK